MQGLTKIEAAIIGGFFAMALGFIGMMFMTPGRWITLKSLHINDTSERDNFPIEYERTVVNPFHGKWLVELWRLNRGAAEPVCSAVGEWNYKPASPDPLQDWAWLVNYEKCKPRGPGKHFARVIIDINPGSVMARRVSIDSNVFRVLP